MSPTDRKIMSAVSHDGVELDAYDDLPAGIRFALEMAKDPWCPPASRERLCDLAMKAAKLLHSLQCR